MLVNCPIWSGDARLQYGVPDRGHSRPFTHALPRCRQHHAAGDVDAGRCMPAEPHSTSSRTCVEPLEQHIARPDRDYPGCYGIAKIQVC